MQTTFEINTQNLQQGIINILSNFPNSEKLIITVKDGSTNKLAQKNIERFNKIQQINKGFSIPNGVDIDKLANECNLY